MRFFFRLCSFLPAAFTAGCSLLFNLSAEQCKSHTDCDALGNEFVGRSCVIGVCEACKSDKACSDARGDEYVCKKPAGKSAGVCKLGAAPPPPPPEDGGSGDADVDGGDASPSGSLMTSSSSAEPTATESASAPAPSVSAEPEPECETNQDCVDIAANYICIENECVNLVTPECPVVLQGGNLTATDPIIIGAYSALNDSNLGREPITLNYDFALHEFTKEGLTLNQKARGFVAVVCEGRDTLNNPVENSLNHLIDTLKVPGIIAALDNTEDLKAAYARAQEAKVFLIDPLYADTSLTALNNTGLLWFILGEWRNLAPAYVELTKRAEDFQKVRSGDSEVRVALLTDDYRPHRDIANVLAYDETNPLVFNGLPASDPDNMNNFKVLEIPEPLTDDDDKTDLRLELLAFKPHIIVLTGGMDFVTEVMESLENWWVDETEVDGQVRPFYVLSPDIGAYSSLPNAALKQVKYSDVITRSAGINFAGYADRTLYTGYRDRLGTYADQVIEEHENFYDATYYMAYSIIAAGNPLTLDGDDLAIGMERITARGKTSYSVGEVNIGSTVITLQGTASDINLKGTMGPSNFYSGTRSRELDGSVWCMKPEGAEYNVLRIVRIDSEPPELTGEFPCFDDF